VWVLDSFLSSLLKVLKHGNVRNCLQCGGGLSFHRFFPPTLMTVSPYSTQILFWIVDRGVTLTLPTKASS
jgi:hypothetical protein